jgi:hypothetical protein
MLTSKSVRWLWYETNIRPRKVTVKLTTAVTCGRQAHNAPLLQPDPRSSACVAKSAFRCCADDHPLFLSVLPPPSGATGAAISFFAAGFLPTAAFAAAVTAAAAFLPTGRPLAVTL